MFTRGNSETNSSGRRGIRATSQLLTQSTRVQCYQRLAEVNKATGFTSQNRFQRSKVPSLPGKPEIEIVCMLKRLLKI